MSLLLCSDDMISASLLCILVPAFSYCDYMSSDVDLQEFDQILAEVTEREVFGHSDASGQRGSTGQGAGCDAQVFFSFLIS